MRIAFTLLLVFVISLMTGQQWQSQLVWENEAGQLQYVPCDNGFLIPDFSHAGYKGGGVEIPVIGVVKSISPITGDNTAHIQAAINEVGARTPDANGFRGALLLKAGVYEVFGTIRVNVSGVVLRGEGDGDDPASNTIVYARGNTPHQRDVVVMGNANKSNWNTQISGTKTNITDELVPVGSRTFSVASTSAYNEGDQIIIYHPCSASWLEAIDFGGVADPNELWSVNQFPIVFNRYIKKIEGNLITVDAPIFYSLNKSLSQSYIYKHNMSGTVYNVGIENLRIDIETLGGTDENHAWQAVRFKSCENAWARNCTFLHFGQSGIITETTTRSTFVNCRALDPVAIVTGERMYNFNTYLFSQLNLFAHNYARKGRHNYISNGTATTSGNVFLRCISDGAQSVNEGHRHWTTGMLFDNHRDINLTREFVLGLYNRVDAGTGHGWSAAHSVLWNCDVTQNGVIGLQKPPTAQNYAIGCIAKRITGRPISASDFPLGFTEGINQPGLYPQSLYEAQLKDRTGHFSSVSDLKENQKALFFYDRDSQIVRYKDERLSLIACKAVTIHDASGRLIKRFETDLIGDNKLFQLALKPGVYLINIEGKTNNYAGKLLVK